MKTKILILLLVILVPNGKSFAIDIIDSCYTINWRAGLGYVMVNPDSVLLDTCACQEIPWTQCSEIYAKKWFRAIFPNGVFNLPEYPHDTTVYVTWVDMDSNFSEIRQKFVELEINFGNYQLIKEFPHRSDSMFPARSFLIRFDNYCKIDSVCNFMQINTYGWIFDYQRRYSGFPTDIVDNSDLLYELDIYPNPASDYIEIYFERCPTSGRCRTSEIIQIYNVVGECVKKNPTPALLHTPAPLKRGINEGVERVDVSDLPTGIYFLRIGDFVGRFVKM